MPRFRADKDHEVFGNIDVTSSLLLSILVKRLMYWNRHDLINEVHGHFNLAKRAGQVPVGREFPNTWGIARQLEQDENRAGEIARVGSTIERGVWSWETIQAHHPRAISRIPVHRKSAVSFILGLVGHSFTGIVRINKVDTELPYKIFLFPTQPSSGRSGAYPTRPYAEDVRAQVFKESASPIKVEGLPSHTQLASMITVKEEYSEYEQDSGDFIGFSVIKGDGPKYPNRYSFTSFSSNKAAFSQQPRRRVGVAMAPQVNGSGSVPQEWANAIRLSVDELLALETDLLTKWGSKERSIPTLDKATWQRTVQRYWS